MSAFLTKLFVFGENKLKAFNLEKKNTRENESFYRSQLHCRYL